MHDIRIDGFSLRTKNPQNSLVLLLTRVLHGMNIYTMFTRLYLRYWYFISTSNITFLKVPNCFIQYFNITVCYTYCNLAWGNCGSTKTNSYLLLQKRALSLITNSLYLAPAEPLFSQLKTPKVSDSHTLQRTIFMHKFISSSLSYIFIVIATI